MQTLATPEQTKSTSAVALHKNQQQPFFAPVQIQPKLSIGATDDPSEREAEAIAGKVMRMPVSHHGNTFFKSSDITSIQRKSKRSEEEEKLQRKSGNGESVTTAPAIVHEVLNSGIGRPLDHTTRSFMETRFNSDFGQVKIHDNRLAAKSADSINALAYTSGNNVVFNSGQYKTNTDSGKKLLAHELVHTMQQGGVQQKTGVIQRSWLGDAWDSVKETASDIGHGVADAASAVGHGVADAASAVGHGIANVASTVGHGIADVAGTIAHGVATAASAVAGGVRSVVSTVAGGVSSAWNAATTWLGGAASSVWSGIQSLGNTALSWLSSAGSHVWAAIRWFGNTAFDVIKEIGTFLWEKLSLLGTNVWSFVSNLPKRIWRIVVHGWEGITVALSWAWSGLSGAASHLWNGISGVFSWLGRGLAGALDWITTGVSNGLDWAIDFIQHPSLEKLWHALTGSLSWAWSGLKGFARWGWNGVVGAAMWVWKGIRGFGSWIWDGIKSGGMWALQLLLYTVEAVGLFEAAEVLWGLIFRMRKLTDPEIAASGVVHPPGMIPYSLIRVDVDSLVSRISGGAVTTFHVLHFPKGGESLDVVVHELTHVAQYESVGAIYIPQALHVQSKYGRSGGRGTGSAYDYEREGTLLSQRAAGKKFKDLNRESQAELVQDYYLCKTATPPTPCSDMVPFIDDMQHGNF